MLKVCDFGIAKQLAPGGTGLELSLALTRTSGLLGSPLYISPEQLRSAKSVDARADVFSLGVSLHEALSGRRPWSDRESIGEIITALCTEDFPSLAATAPWIDAGLVRVLERALARDPAARYQSVAELAEALRPFALDRPVLRADIRRHRSSSFSG